MWGGVGKSGSPAPNPMTSIPSALICLALAVMARVGEGLRFSTRRLSFTGSSFFGTGETIFFLHGLHHDRRGDAADAGTQAEHFLDDAGADVGVLLARGEEKGLGGRVDLAVHQ